MPFNRKLVASALLKLAKAVQADDKDGEKKELLKQLSEKDKALRKLCESYSTNGALGKSYWYSFVLQSVPRSLRYKIVIDAAVAGNFPQLEMDADAFKKNVIAWLDTVKREFAGAEAKYNLLQKPLAELNALADKFEAL